MNNTQCHCMAKSAAPRMERLPDAQYASLVRKQSVSAYESLDAGLTIQTREGDVVTLTSSTYAQVDSFLYDSKGVLMDETGTQVAQQNYREITLSTGEQFSFMVSGDLNEDEIADIEDIVESIDQIISEMAQGDMEDAVAKAVAMGGYDTVSSYAADITYQKTYAAREEVQAQAETLAKMPKPEILPTEDKKIPSVSEPFPENHVPRKKKNNSIKNINQFIEKMADRLEKADDKVLDHAKKPVDKLFKKHMERQEDEQRSAGPHYNALDVARRKVSSFIEEMLKGMFKGILSDSME